MASASPSTVAARARWLECRKSGIGKQGGHCPSCNPRISMKPSCRAVPDLQLFACIKLPGMSLLTRANLVDGTPHPPVDGNSLDPPEPATGRPFARCPASGKADVDAAADAARRAALGW